MSVMWPFPLCFGNKSADTEQVLLWKIPFQQIVIIYILRSISHLMIALWGYNNFIFNFIITFCFRFIIWYLLVSFRTMSIFKKRFFAVFIVCIHYSFMHCLSENNPVTVAVRINLWAILDNIISLSLLCFEINYEQP